jgi:hypothetical protein
MRKFFLTLVLVLSIVIANAASLCGGGMKFTFTGGDRGNVEMTSSGGTLKGTYLVDNKNNIRIVWSTGYEAKLVFVSDGVYSYGSVTLKECK